MDTLGIWIGLNFLETFLFYYLLFGTVIDRKTLKTKDKWILYFVLIVTSTIISVWVKRSVFSAYGYLLTIFILVLGSFLAYRKKLILLTGIASMYGRQQHNEESRDCFRFLLRKGKWQEHPLYGIDFKRWCTQFIRSFVQTLRYL